MTEAASTASTTPEVPIGPLRYLDLIALDSKPCAPRVEGDEVLLDPEEKFASSPNVRLVKR